MFFSQWLLGSCANNCKLNSTPEITSAWFDAGWNYTVSRDFEP